MSLINVGEDTFQKEVMESEKLVIADFWASWCMPCKMVEPVLEKLAELYENDVKIVRVNVDEQSELTSRYNILSIPAMFFFKNGEVVDKQIGAVPQNVLEEKLKAHI